MTSQKANTYIKYKLIIQIKPRLITRLQNNESWIHNLETKIYILKFKDQSLEMKI